jgi:hypothetical protein
LIKSMFFVPPRWSRHVLFFPPVRTCPHSISGCPWVCPGAAETREYSRVPAETLPDPSNSELDRGRHSGQTLAEGDTTNTAWFIFTSPPPCNLPVVGSFRAGTLNPQPSPPVPTHRRHRPTGRRHKAAGHLGDADTQYGRCARPILTRPMRPHDVVSSMIISSRTPWSRSVVPLFNSPPPANQSRCRSGDTPNWSWTLALMLSTVFSAVAGMTNW